MYLPPRKNDRTARLPLMASTQPVRDLSIAMAPAEAVGARGRRGLVVPFETGGALPEGAKVSYTLAAFGDAGRAAGRSSGSVKVIDGMAAGVAHIAVDPRISLPRLAAVADHTRSGSGFATVRMAAAKAERPARGGFLFEQAGPSKGLCRFERDQPLVMATVVSARSLDNLPLAFGILPRVRGRSPPTSERRTSEPRKPGTRNVENLENPENLDNLEPP